MSSRNHYCSHCNKTINSYKDLLFYYNACQFYDMNMYVVDYIPKYCRACYNYVLSLNSNLYECHICGSVHPLLLNGLDYQCRENSLDFILDEPCYFEKTYKKCKWCEYNLMKCVKCKSKSMDICVRCNRTQKDKTVLLKSDGCCTDCHTGDFQLVTNLLNAP